MENGKKEREFAFIKEKIKDKPINKRRLLIKLIWEVFFALIFGLTACLIFVVAKPKLEKLIYPPEEPSITIPKDTQPQEPVEPEKTEPEQKEPETVYVKEELEIDDYQELQNKLYAIGKKANKSVVTVTAVTSGMDWFNSSYESKNQTSGIIIGNNGQELLIMTEKKVITEAEALNITFINDDVVSATLKNYDGNTGIAIICVSLADIKAETLEKVEVAQLGNSLTVNQGTVVLAVGSPLGANYSILSGTITSSGNTVTTMDSTYTIFTTDILGSANGSGVLINLSGEVVGLILQNFGSEGDRNTITALSISELKVIIEDLSNGKDIPYLGLKVSTVTDEIALEFGIPKGVFIISVAPDSPAMTAGMQEADVIKEINGEEITSVEQYTQKLQMLEPGQQVQIKVQRQGAEAYVEMDYATVVGILK